MLSGKKLNVLVVGCGNIAGGFDADLMDDGWPSTHAGAYCEDGRFNLLACIEPDEQVRSQFMRRWAVKQGFSCMDEVKTFQDVFDVVSVCSPTKCHKHDVMEAIKLSPKLIFCEKPVTGSSQDTEELIQLCEQAGVLLCVNHNRRWDPELIKLKHDIKESSYGQLRSVVAYYNKGVLNNGSHLIDLLHCLLGDLKIIATAQATIDWSERDPTVPALLHSEKGVPIHLVTSHAQDFSLFELQLIFSAAVLTMQDGGLSWSQRTVQESDRFSGYRSLSKAIDNVGGYQCTMLRAVDNIYQAVVVGSNLLSDGKSACRAQKVCERIANFK